MPVGDYLTPRFDRNHNDTGQSNQENLEPFEHPL